jgi:N6-L-threonylcarbamoyladenine synthase
MTKETLILGIDTSCDDTSAAVVRNGREILSNIVSSQAEVHGRFGGIVPELASRRHIEMIWPVVRKALDDAGTGSSDLHAIAVCNGPGLVGSLLVGLCFGKALAYSTGLPLIGINHLEGHIYSNLFSPSPPDSPFLSLTVSGGHTLLVLVRGSLDYRVIGSTRDDAAGEAYDKVAKLLGLGYPGGPLIEKAASEGNPDKVPLPRPMMNEGFDFSFSGLKTAVRNAVRELRKKGVPEEEIQRDISASFQSAVVDVLLHKSRKALQSFGIEEIALSGGVSANGTLRRAFLAMEKEGIRVHLPEKKLCTDNAAMIAAAGHHHYIMGDRAGLDLNAHAVLPLR